MSGRIGIENVAPVVSAGRYPAKAVVGEHIPITATVWREGHDAVGATLVWRGPSGRHAGQRTMQLASAGLDGWAATLVPVELGQWSFRVDGWSDPWMTWCHGIQAKIGAGWSADRLANELAEGGALLRRAASSHRGAARVTLLAAERMLGRTALPLPERVAPALGPQVAELLRRRPLRDLVTHGRTYPLLVERRRALAGAWYELFPRSTGGVDRSGEPVHGTFVTTAAALDRVAAMGFDVVYLPPVHPIGRVHRKGRNNSTSAGAGDVGSPWAIGAAEGGHLELHPELGTIDEFDALVRRAGELGLEVAMDLALQCAPDHPWVSEHPQWFTHRPDATIAYAENPPKRYEDIYPLNFDNDPAGLRAEVVRILRFWIDHGIRIFRVDNPHTKPLDFWNRLLQEIRRIAPDVVFLAEAFTRPAMMHGLGRLGFSQSYTYFTWRTTKQELTEYLTELAESLDHMRPNLWVNTPDILPRHLVGAGPGMFAIRAALAATLGPSWGVYSGYELHENDPLTADGEEYLDSEKYELRPRDFTTPGSLEQWITALNAARRRHPALGNLRTLHFHHIDHDALLAYSKHDPATGDTVLCLVNLDPDRAHSATLRLDMSVLGRRHDGELRVRDALTGRRAVWSANRRVRLDPLRRHAAVYSLELS